MVGEHCSIFDSSSWIPPGPHCVDRSTFSLSALYFSSVGFPGFATAELLGDYSEPPLEDAVGLGLSAVGASLPAQEKQGDSSLNRNLSFSRCLGCWYTTAEGWDCSL